MDMRLIKRSSINEWLQSRVNEKYNNKKDYWGKGWKVWNKTENVKLRTRNEFEKRKRK